MLLSCTSAPECPPAEPCPEGPSLTEFEASLIDPLVESVRRGVQPWGPEGVGVCRGARTCEAFLGVDPGALEPGEYLVRAELKVPPVGPAGTWTVEYRSTCTAEGSEPADYTRTYELVSPGLDRPYRIGVLRRITSPGPRGPESCTYELVSPHPDGASSVSGGWSTP